jgi:non-canonical purine NTP pyrophosphatase (RdgB/HAM1 family)
VKLVLASGNHGKLREIGALLAPLAIEVVVQSELKIGEADEPHVTFLENALAKARHASRASGLAALADDSGLCVEALGGEPGVHSAYYAGREGSREERDRRNNQKLLLNVKDNRSAYYVCVMALVRKPADPRPLVAEGVWRGEIARAPRGSSGFGYDPLFLLPERGKTAGELDTRSEERISRRGPSAPGSFEVSTGMEVTLERPRTPSLKVLPPLALYVHIPWCVRKCPYCDFNSHERGGALPEREYVERLFLDLENLLPSVWGRRLVSVFIGGGTPSLFSPASIDTLLSGVRARLPLEPDAEITLEANPGTVEAARFRGFREAGVSRISIGVQSFDDRMLAALGRIHSAAEARRAVDAAARSFDNVNLDLMYGLPGQSAAMARNDVEQALACGVPHVWSYQLTLEPNSVLWCKLHRLPLSLTICWLICSSLLRRRSVRRATSTMRPPPSRVRAGAAATTSTTGSSAITSASARAPMARSAFPTGSLATNGSSSPPNT